jgi:hypothetical protein
MQYSNSRRGFYILTIKRGSTFWQQEEDSHSDKKKKKKKKQNKIHILTYMYFPFRVLQSLEDNIIMQKEALFGSEKTVSEIAIR